LFCAAPSPNPQCYASAITACARAHDPRSAMRLLADMREDGVPPNDVVLNAAVDACGKVVWGSRGVNALELAMQLLF
ncbi:unnamed protein product, partial [Ectocarpus sp. 12 AP-2014]